MRGLRTVAGIAVAWAATGCGAGYFNYHTVRATELPFEDVWNICVEQVTESGFELDPKLLDRGRRTLVTKWNGNPVAFDRLKKTGRTRVHLEIDRLSSEDFNVRFYIERQTNSNMAHALQPLEEDWSSAGQAVEAESLLAYHLQSGVADRKGLSAPRVHGIEYEEPLRGVKRH